MEMREGAWGDFITLQAAVQRYELEINLVTSISEPALIQFPIIPMQAHQKVYKLINYNNKAINNIILLSIADIPQ
jgi:hypothetical protein